MCKTRILLALFAAIAIFGLAASGCNNNKTTAMRSTKQSRNVRPAEVLSASAYRPPVRSMQPLPAPAAAPVYTQAPAYSAAPAAYSPSLAMAYPAAQAPVYQPQIPQPVVLARAPIPELEPARFARVVNRQPAQRPVAEVMMTARPVVNGDRQEVIKALSPINTVTPVAANTQKWVASPVTAMNNQRILY
jgi:hypothetical protein